MTCVEHTETGSTVEGVHGSGHTRPQRSRGAEAARAAADRLVVLGATIRWTTSDRGPCQSSGAPAASQSSSRASRLVSSDSGHVVHQLRWGVL